MNGIIRERIRDRNQVNLVESSKIPKTYSEAKLKEGWPKWEKAIQRGTIRSNIKTTIVRSCNSYRSMAIIDGFNCQHELEISIVQRKNNLLIWRY